MELLKISLFSSTSRHLFIFLLRAKLAVGRIYIFRNSSFVSLFHHAFAFEINGCYLYMQPNSGNAKSSAMANPILT